MLKNVIFLRAQTVSVVTSGARLLSRIVSSLNTTSQMDSLPIHFMPTKFSFASSMKPLEVAYDSVINFSGGFHLPRAKQHIHLSVPHIVHFAIGNASLSLQKISNSRRKFPVSALAVKELESHGQRHSRADNRNKTVREKKSLEHVQNAGKVYENNDNDSLSEESSSANTTEAVSTTSNGNHSDTENTPNSSSIEDFKALFWRIQEDPNVQENLGRKLKDNSTSSIKSNVKTEDASCLPKHKEPVMNILHKFDDRIKHGNKDQNTGKNGKASRKGSFSREWVNKNSKRSDISSTEFFQQTISRPPSEFVRKSPIPLSAIKKSVRPVPGLKEMEYVKQNMLTSSSDVKLPSSDNGSFLNHSPSSSEFQFDDLGKYRLSELREYAKSHGLKGYSRLKKLELLQLLKTKINQI